ncbi:MAG: carboxypeptidase regulatory-like domain-containing protein [Planctomycetes bacterium]|nr:carboxypeptidase regulatory-like domain-containing protein [Planctomycetota bacterium]
MPRIARTTWLGWTRSRRGVFALGFALAVLVSAGWFVAAELRSTPSDEVRPVSKEDAGASSEVAQEPTMVAAIESVAPDSAGELEATRAPVEEGDPRATRRRGELKWFEGLVVLPDGAPSDEALTVVVGYQESAATDESEFGIGSFEIERVSVDNEGKFRFSCPVDSEECAVIVAGRWLRLASPESVDLDAGDAVVVLRPEIGARLRLTVRAPYGAPDVSLSPLSGELSFGEYEWMDADELDGAADFIVGQPLELGPLSVAAKAVRLNVDGIENFEHALPTLVAGVVNEVEVSLPPRAWVSGRVRDLNGSPVADAKVVLHPEDWDAAAWLTTRSAADGSFRFYGAPTDVELELEATSDDHYRAESVKLGVLGSGQRLEHVQFVLDEGGVLAGVVVTPSGEPASFACVAAVPLGGAGPGQRNQTDCDEKGRFRLSALRRMEHRVSIKYTGRESEELLYKAIYEHVELREDVLFRLEPTSSVKGRVVDSRGAPVNTFEARASLMRRAGSRVAPGREDFTLVTAGRVGDGALELNGLLSGEWKIEVGAVGYDSAQPRYVTLPSEVGSLDFQLVQCARISGVTVDAAGVPVGRIPIRARAAGAESRRVGVSGRDGEFANLYVSAGAVELLVRSGGYELVSPLELQLEPGEVREVRLVVVKR